MNKHHNPFTKILLASLMLSTLNAQEPTPPTKSCWRQCKEALQGLSDEVALHFWASVYGDKNVSPETDAYVRNVLRNIGVQDVDSIHIKQLSKIAIYSGMTEKNACAVTFKGFPRYLYFNEPWLLTLSNEAKDFLIAHEGMHLHLGHCTKLGLTCYFSYLLPYLSYINADTICDNKVAMVRYGKGTFDIVNVTSYVHEANSAWLKKASIAAFLVGQALVIKLSRMFELQADGEAARLLGNPDGAQELFDEFSAFEKELDADLPQRADLVAARKTVRELFYKYLTSHPSGEARMKNIKDILAS